MKQIAVLFFSLLFLCMSCVNRGNNTSAEDKNIIGRDSTNIDMKCIWSDVLKREVRLCEEGEKLESVIDSASVNCCYFMFSEDSSVAELFMPDFKVMLEKRIRRDGSIVWNVEDDDTYQIELHNNVWLLARRGKLLYSSLGFGKKIKTVFVGNGTSEFPIVFYNNEGVAQITIDGFDYLLYSNVTASGYDYSCPIYDLRGKGDEAVLTDLRDERKILIKEKH